ncbi:MAG: CRISPR-associated endonuclease Cas3'' [Pseudomonadales bacterium]|nr:CRISPR-associated endonuclease Cas3'' [Pseudomonadales bacterium]
MAHLHVMNRLIAEIIGLCHDLGKATVLFQRKLREADFPASDPVRHEWVSLKLLDLLLAGTPLIEAFNQLSSPRLNQFPFPKKQGLNSAIDVVRFCVATHHGLFSPYNKEQFALSSSAGTLNHIRNKAEHPYHQNPTAFLVAQADLDSSIMEAINAGLERLSNLPVALDETGWRAVATYTRACLIMADHTVSARHLRHSHPALAANTLRTPGNKQHILNQDLNYHLREVGALARTLSENLLSYIWPGISDASLARLSQRSPLEGRFHWQNNAADCLHEARANSTAPALVLDVASTGAGKTRMNMRAAAVLNQRPQCRITSVLNLRTLTLQTSKVYQTELQLQPDELACVIGDKTIKTLFDRAQPNTDEDPEGMVFEASSSAQSTPDFLSEYLQTHLEQAGLITTPVLVSTIDFVVAAGEPHRQGHHAAALARVLSSDLIIDEIDDYEPHAFVAVLRLVEIAAMMGSNVIVSSATLPVPMVQALVEVFQSATRQFYRINDKPPETPIIALIDNYLPPQLFKEADAPSLAQNYATRIANAVESVKGQNVRIPQLARFEAETTEAFFERIESSTKELHDQLQWTHEATGKSISVGLVRIANIGTAIQVAQRLSEAFPDDYIATYHANEFLIQRHQKEVILDSLLTRKNDNQALETSPYVKALLERSNSASVKLIVVATPVEEVGRDHDFDWAVIEPSSARSIVQTSGRVNRHRLQHLPCPNIHVLQYNYRHCDQQILAFLHPGFEIDSRHPWSHDLAELLHWNQLHEIDASVRIGNHPMATLEDQVIHSILKRPIETMIGKRRPQDWMTGYFYNQYPLRELNRKDIWVLIDDDFHVWTEGPLGFEPQNQNAKVTRTSPTQNAWLSWTVDELKELSTCYGIDPLKAFEVNITRYGESMHDLVWDQSFGFTRRSH